MTKNSRSWFDDLDGVGESYWPEVKSAFHQSQQPEA
jgi:hypothetical protein